MANLSLLEKRELKDIFKAAKQIKKLLAEHSDNVHDVLCEQIEIKTSPNEKMVMDSFMEFSKQSFTHLETIMDSSDILEDHFILK